MLHVSTPGQSRLAELRKLMPSSEQKMRWIVLCETATFFHLGKHAEPRPSRMWMSKASDNEARRIGVCKSRTL